MEFYAHTVIGYQGEKLYTAWYPPKSHSKGGIVWVHGYAEHSGRYMEVVAYLIDKGWGSLIWDLRGHGRSTGKRGFVTDIEEYLYDLTAVWTYWREKIAKPVVLFGHSLGGLIVLRYRQKYQEIWEPLATLVSAPLIQLKLKIPPWKQVLGNLAGRFFPTLTLPSGLNPTQLTHDPTEAKAYATDPLVFSTATAGWFAAVQRAQRELWHEVPRFSNGRYLFILPEEDPICDSQAARQLYHHLGTSQKRLICYPESYHEPLHETFREKVFQDIADYLATL
ncbi:MAG: alpha/beta hydrolase [Bacteroidia bacterium]|nr:lysophospholipase [Bacteroidia bacterium]MDW8134030.1 alpha/beta hydrolase [Bacteroidia bacterium]